MSGMNNPTLHRHVVHGLQGATPSSCLHDLVPFAGPSHDQFGSCLNTTDQISSSLVLLRLYKFSSVLVSLPKFRTRLDSVKIGFRTWEAAGGGLNTSCGCFT
ncbi:hypothetical protein F2Q69_00058895 [Brassica cretica]|uniref:Uncharacterized protein n=1 Tax=Brassica cretica TaxID=69181 RepID=A0A8S9RML6_BRACR|nr:hypothetical protein F2Q69_00058895 [Brassica cretica]